MAGGPGTQPSTSSSDQSSSQDSLNKQSQVPTFDGVKSSDGNIPKFPVMYPALVPGLFPPHQDQEQINRGPGLYAVPVLPYMQPIAGFPSNTLIPFTYNIPTERRSPETGEVGGEQGQPGSNHKNNKKLDLKDKYQTGALAPVVRWLSQGMRRAAAPPQPPRPAVRAANLPAAGGPGNENVGIADGQPVGENENQQADDGIGLMRMTIKQVKLGKPRLATVGGELQRKSK
ncbi:hypothetical protein DH2020_039647 [Rehmannia glutinosa]|uniref:Uncharacterized protein n=1 Tax=Rehmannia glutinosa TaxID=99300 RepID=A0ABR0UWH8_REHGL